MQDMCFYECSPNLGPWLVKLTDMRSLPVLCVLLLPWCIVGLEPATDGKTEEQLLNSCLDGMHHKQVPGPEGSLYQNCAPWKDRACCRANVTEKMHQEELFPYNFQWHHCGQLSPQCERHFMQDMCFYECSPNLGPWLVKIQMKIRNERFVNVPLCASDCNQWWEACKDDMTCSGNWGKGWNWTSGVNECPRGNQCKTFKKYFGDATNFCQKIWDGSFTVVPDTEPCMTQWFNGLNPNNAVARKRAKEIVQASAGKLSATVSYVLLGVGVFLGRLL